MLSLIKVLLICVVLCGCHHTTRNQVTFLTQLPPLIIPQTKEDIFRLAKKNNLLSSTEMNLLTKRLRSWSAKSIWFINNSSTQSPTTCSKIVKIKDEWRWYPQESNQYYQVSIEERILLTGPMSQLDQGAQGVGALQQWGDHLSLVDQQSAIFGGIPVRLLAQCISQKKLMSCSDGSIRYCTHHALVLTKKSLVPNHVYGISRSGKSWQPSACQVACPKRSPSPNLDQLNQRLSAHTFYDPITKRMTLFRTQQGCEQALQKKKNESDQ